MGLFRTVPRPVMAVLKVLITVIAIVLIVRKVDFSAMGEALATVSWGWLFAVIAMQILVAVIQALRWKVLVPASVGLRKYLYYVFVGYVLNTFLPSAALAEGARTYAFGRRYGAVQKNLIAMVFGRGVGFAVSMFIAGAAFLYSGTRLSALPAWDRAGLPWEWIAIITGLALILGVAAALRLRARIASAWADLVAFCRDGRLMLNILALSVLMQVVILLSAQWIFRSVGWDLAVWQAALIPVLVQLLLLVPISAGGVGVREYLSLALYGGLAGVPVHVVLAASILSYVPLLVLTAAGAGWMLYRRHEGGQ